MIQIENIEMHAAHGCDHACAHCSHFSNHSLGGVLSLDDADRQMGFWSHRLAPHWFSVLGGEPTLHPRLPELLEICCLHWPRVRLVTNGSFLSRHPRLPQVLESHQILLEISVHHDGPAYRQRVVRIKQLINEWQMEHHFAVRIRESFQSWQQLFRGEGTAILPFQDGRPEESWNACRSRWCPQIFEGRIYKCPPTAYMELMRRKYGLAPEWDPYLGYKPLEPGCSDDVLKEFVTRRAEPICRMCPAAPETIALPDPLAHRRQLANEGT